MSAEAGSKTEQVYVRLLGEGTIVYRPALAVIKGADVALLVEPDGYDPDDEDWEFKPGTLVRLEERVWDGQRVLVVLSRG
jgi:hypothetical protein